MLVTSNVLADTEKTEENFAGEFTCHLYEVYIEHLVVGVFIQ